MLWMIVKDRVAITAEAFGPLVLAHYADSMDRALAVRDRLDPARFVDVDYDALVDDNLAAARAIYAHFGLPFEGRARAALEAHAASHPKDKHGKHEYDLATYGLTRAQVDTRFAAYRERFGV
jgi:hypothetical protein